MMSELHLRPMRHDDMRALCPKQTRKAFARTLLQMNAAPTFVICDEKRVYLAFGFYPWGHGIAELWLLFAQGLTRSDKVRCLRYGMTRARSFMTDVPVIAHILDNNSSGQRLATMAGFVATVDHYPGTLRRVWVRRIKSKGTPHLTTDRIAHHNGFKGA